MMRRYVDLDRLDVDLWRRPGWRNEAACRGLDSELFHPERGEVTEPAKMICFGCPVRNECLTFALAHYEKHGIWGGLSERERRPLRRRLAAQGRIEVPPSAVRHAEVPDCGTIEGYWRHARLKERVCEACRAARARHSQAQRASVVRYRDGL